MNTAKIVLLYINNTMPNTNILIRVNITSGNWVVLLAYESESHQSVVLSNPDSAPCTGPSFSPCCTFLP